VIPTLPSKPRNRLAETILAALSDEASRRILRQLAAGEGSLANWLEPEGHEQVALVRQRARAATEALLTRPLISRHPSRTEALAAAAALFDAGLHFEVHELLEPHWVSADGEERQALQGLIQVAVGYQHLANGNLAGARALLGEGSDRLHAGRLPTLELTAFADAVRASISRLAAPDQLSVPPFPRQR